MLDLVIQWYGTSVRESFCLVLKAALNVVLSARSSKAPHLHQEALVVLPQVAVGLQQALQVLPQPRPLVRVLRTQPGDQQHRSWVNWTPP